MNEIQKVDHIFHAVDAAQEQFEAIVARNPTVNWEAESMFAYQMVSANSFIMDVAKNNRESVKNAVINIAAVGLSLNPATKYAYLVPRGGAICLDISYQGLIKVATDSGSIKWAKAELVYEADEFVYRGPSEKPEHHADPFKKDRGNLVGVYCIAKTHDGDFLVETMTVDEVYKIRDEASKAAKGPWSTYPGEMTKKVVIKRAQKTWPKTEQHERLQTAVKVINEIDGSDWAEEVHRFKPGEKVTLIENMREALIRGDAWGVVELVDEYTKEDPEEAMKFWALFNSVERASINRLMDNSKIEQDRITMKRPDLNVPLEAS